MAWKDQVEDLRRGYQGHQPEPRAGGETGAFRKARKPLHGLPRRSCSELAERAAKLRVR